MLVSALVVPRFLIFPGAAGVVAGKSTITFAFRSDVDE
jgi:hypothetical protein